MLGKFIFSIIIGIVEKLFASHLSSYLETYHQTQKAKETANAPLDKQELLDSFH